MMGMRLSSTKSRAVLADEELVFAEAGVEMEEVEVLEFETHECTWLGTRD